MALPKNRQAVQALLEELKPRILGKEHGGFTCNCGAIHCGAAVAEAIEPAGDTYPGQEIRWFAWSVRMKAHDGSGWSCDLSEFIKADELKTMFMRYYGDQKRVENPYNLALDDEDRVYAGLQVAVRIKENADQFRFTFSWGREQATAERLYKQYKRGPRRIPAGSEAFVRIVNILSGLKTEVYQGGPDPELPFESQWLLDYSSAMAQAQTVANHLFFQNNASVSDWRGYAYTKADIVFMKHEVK